MNLEFNIKNLSESDRSKLFEILEKTNNFNSDSPFNVQCEDKAFYNEDEYNFSHDSYWSEDEIEKLVPCKDMEIVKARQKRHKLSDELERYAHNRNAVVTPDMWKDKNIAKYSIRQNGFNEAWVGATWEIKEPLTVYFSRIDVAEDALKEIFVPFEREKN